MDIHTAAHYMRHGYRIRRPSRHDLYYLYSKDDALWEFSLIVGNLPTYLLNDDLLATDWELITEGVIKYFPIIYSD
jgi:hypothetical protein